MPEAHSQYSIYPRGFLGRVVEPRVEKKTQPPELRLGGGGNVVTFGRPKTLVIPNPNVEALYKLNIDQPLQAKSFEFRERVLITALDAFGTKNFFEWVSLQYRSPSAGDMHRRFLADTMRFIETGHRELHTMTWANLVDVTDSGNVGPDFSEEVVDFFGLNPATKQPTRNQKLIDVVQTWCTRRGGCEDMLGTLHVLFGDI